MNNQVVPFLFHCYGVNLLQFFHRSPQMTLLQVHINHCYGFEPEFGGHVFSSRKKYEKRRGGKAFIGIEKDNISNSNLKYC